MVTRSCLLYTSMSRMQIALLIVGEGLFLCIPALLGGLAAGFCLVYLLEEGSSLSLIHILPPAFPWGNRPCGRKS